MTDDDLPIIDAHHHLWELGSGALYYPWLQDDIVEAFFLGDNGPLKRNYLAADYRRDSARHRVLHTVHVEAECDRRQQVAETRWLSELNAACGMPSAIVAHAWFHTDDASDILAQQAAHPLVRGIRSKPVTRKSLHDLVPTGAGTMQDPKWLEGLGRLREFSLSWDLRVPTWHLEEAAQVVGTYPDLAVVLNHTGFPWDRSEAGLALWRRGMQALAAHPNCHCKLSCLCVPDGPWDYDDNRAIVLETIDMFGVERCMFASNFPVDGLRVDFATMFDDFKRMTRDFAAAERQRLFFDNAARFYRIDTTGS